MISAALQRLRWRVFRALSPKRQIHGIEVLLDVHARHVEDEDLFEKMDEALSLIAQYQPWRLKQMQRVLSLVIVRRRASNRAALIGATTAELDWTFVLKHSSEEVAASLIHEAVHARIHRWIGWGTEERRARDERLCRQAELSFAEAIPNGDVVRERASQALAGGDNVLAPPIDHAEVSRLNARAYWDELDLPDWLERWRMRRARGRRARRE